MTAPLRTLAALLAVSAVLAACSSAGPASVESQPPGTVAEELTVSVDRTYPHDRTAFTQGLEVSGTELFESTGRKGSSYIAVSALDSQQPLRRAVLDADYFGEGITVSDEILWQITWQDGVAIARDPGTLAEKNRVSYDGEGWGLCRGQNSSLVMSDGSSTLTFRDPVTFEKIGTTNVTVNGEPLSDLNELECAEDGSVYANVWQTFDIARIDVSTGHVTAMIDARPLYDALTEQERVGVDVLNGIAQIPGTDRFLLTGKLWPTMYEARFTPQK